MNENRYPPIWLDSSRVVRRLWKQFEYRAHGLKNVAKHVGVIFDHHDALQDANVGGTIVYHACEEAEMSVTDWLERVQGPVTLNETYTTKIPLEGNPEGPLYGETLVCTGSLSLKRSDGARIAADLGCDVRHSMNKRTTIVVVRSQDSSERNGYDKSYKHRKAGELMRKGLQIVILTETEFIKICNEHNRGLNFAFRKEQVRGNKQKLKTNINRHMEKSVKIEISHNGLEITDTFVDAHKKALTGTVKRQQDAIKSINKCTHVEKRKPGAQFQQPLDTINSLYETTTIASFEDGYFGVLSTIEVEVSQIQDYLYDLVKNKISVGR